jgi:hypothetical protein
VAAQIERDRKVTRDIEKAVRQARGTFTQQKIRLGEVRGSLIPLAAYRPAVEHVHGVVHGAVMAFLAGSMK